MKQAKINKVVGSYYVEYECKSPIATEKCNADDCEGYRTKGLKYCEKCQCFYCMPGNCIKRNPTFKNIS